MALWKEPVKSPATAAPETTDQARLDIPDNKPETACLVDAMNTLIFGTPSRLDSAS